MSGLRTNSPLEQLLEEIKFQRRKELRTQVTHFHSCGGWIIFCDKFKEQLVWHYLENLSPLFLCSCTF